MSNRQRKTDLLSLKHITVTNHPDFFKELYRILYDTYGPQGWWSAKSPFEVIVGAILTQSTNWRNVKKALDNLHREKVLTPAKLNSLKLPQLAQLIRPSGYYNQKAIKLKNFLNYLFEKYNGSLKKMAARPWEELRLELLDVHGIGPETADSILLYAFNKPVFVVDAYTKRILVSHKLINEKATYRTIQELFTKNLIADVKLFNECHALIVRVGKEHYRGNNISRSSPLKNLHYNP